MLFTQPLVCMHHGRTRIFYYSLFGNPRDRDQNNDKTLVITQPSTISVRVQEEYGQGNVALAPLCIATQDTNVCQPPPITQWPSL